MFWFGMAAAFCASALFSIAVALQALEARIAPKEEGLRIALLVRLLRRPRWVAGLVLGGLGVVLQVVAFANAPLVAVQPALAGGLVLLLALAVSVLGERVRGIEILGVVAMVGGIALLTWGAPEHVETHRSSLRLIVVLAVVSIPAAIPFALRGGRWDSAAAVIIGASLAYTASNLATKLFTDDFVGRHLVASATWGLLAAVAGIAATINAMTALQRRPATTVVPISFSIQTFMPVLVEPFFLKQRWGSAALGGVPLVCGLLLILVGIVVIARAPAVSALVAGSE